MNYKEKGDSKLVAESLNGNLDAFAVLINRYEDKLKRYVMRISNISKEDAEDILQDTFIKVYCNLADFDNKMSFSAWVYRIARNETISRYRKNMSRPQGHSIYVDEDILNNITKDGTDIFEHILQSERQDKINEAIEKLDDKYREVIILRYFENKNYIDIADILQIPTGTVSTLIYRAKKKLKEKLKAYE